MKIEIDNLIKHPQYISQVTKWLYSEWGNNNFNYWKSWVSHSLSTNDIPQTYIIFVEGNIAGTYSLWRCDLQSRQDLFPWFGGLYVDKTFRGKSFEGQKLGVILQQDAIKRVKKFGYSKLYLFTEKKPYYYVSNGWKIYDYAFDENDNQVIICKYEISENRK